MQVKTFLNLVCLAISIFKGWASIKACYRYRNKINKIELENTESEVVYGKRSRDCHGRRLDNQKDETEEKMRLFELGYISKSLGTLS